MVAEYLYGFGKRKHIPDEELESSTARNVYTLCDHVYGYRTIAAYTEDLFAQDFTTEEIDAELVRLRAFPVCGTCSRVQESRVRAG